MKKLMLSVMAFGLVASAASSAGAAERHRGDSASQQAQRNLAGERVRNSYASFPRANENYGAGYDGRYEGGAISAPAGR